MRKESMIELRTDLKLVEAVALHHGPNRGVFAGGQEVTRSLVERVNNLALDSEVDDSVVVALP
jgi:hypothetical protein